MAQSVLDRASLEAVAQLFAVLAEPTRLELLQVLKGGPRSVTDLVAALGGKQANISKQLGILHAAGLLRRERDGIMVRYSISEPMIFDLCEMVCGKLRRDAEARLHALQPRPTRKR